MNEQDESEGSTPPIIFGLTPVPSNSHTNSQLTQPEILPAALKLANLIPHARGTESLLPQRRWLLLADQTAQILRGRWGTFILPAASILTVLSGPGNVLMGSLHSAPAGLLAVIGSFLLFALGTAAALTKHRWHRTSA